MVRRRFLLLGTAALGAAGAFLLRRGTASADARFSVTHSDQEWRKLLNAESYAVLRQQGTEAPGSSPLDHEFAAGTYACAGCALPLFAAATKFDSGTGWPSFYQPLAKAVATQSDNSMLMDRTEVHCARCGGHLGHVFEDGPKPTGLRYCMNGVALTFRKADRS